MSLWIESRQDLARHPKMLRLARMLKIDKAKAIGHLHLLWWWTLDYSPSGELSAFTSCELAEAAEWKGDADNFIKALIECGSPKSGFLDVEPLRIHDWYDFAGKLLERKKRNADRMRKERAMHVRSTCEATNHTNHTNKENITKESFKKQEFENPIPPQHDAFAPTTGIDRFESAMNPVCDEIEAALKSTRKEKGLKTASTSAKWREGIQLLAKLNSSAHEWSSGVIQAHYKVFLAAQKAQKPEWTTNATLRAFAEHIDEFAPKPDKIVSNSKKIEEIINPRKLTDDEHEKNEAARKAAFQKLREQNLI